jgi:hypothetical protein
VGNKKRRNNEKNGNNEKFHAMRKIHAGGLPQADTLLPSALI